MALQWTQDIDDMFTTTWSNRKTEAIEQAYKATPFWFWLKEKGRIEELSGGTRIEVPVEYGKNDTATWLSKGGTVPLTENQLMTMTYEDWKYVSVTLMRFGIEDQQNKGPNKIIDYTARKTARAEEALDTEFERVFFATGTGDNEPNGLINLVSATPTTGTVHGINRATAGYEWWRNLQKSSTGVTSVALIPDMRNCLNTMSLYTKINLKDIFLLTTQTIYEAYEDELLEYKVIQNSTLGDASFEHQVYKGRPMMWAEGETEGYMHFINPRYLYCVIDPGYFMDMTEWKPIPDQVNDRVAQIVCTIQMIVTRPISQLVMTGIVVG
ncbi:MAG: phage major capsid protein [Candidatus Bipolaricaulis sp.]|jgi:hypothetical protein|nr:phage major capsid protein [Candidatus Bipolaricaulis sp.]